MHGGATEAHPRAPYHSGMPGTPDSRSAAERLLDEAIELTFPASDPISVDHAFTSAHDKARKKARATPDPDAPG